jgi:hypothetical protein
LSSACLATAIALHVCDCARAYSSPWHGVT